MRVRFKLGNDIILTNIETVYYDELDGVLQFYEMGSDDPDYEVNISEFDAITKISNLLERGYLDMIGYSLLYDIFE